MANLEDFGWPLRQEHGTWQNALSEANQVWDDDNSATARIRFLEPHQQNFENMDAALRGQFEAMNQAQARIAEAKTHQHDFFIAQQDRLKACAAASSDAQASRKSDSIARDRQSAAQAALERARNTLSRSNAPILTHPSL